MFSLYRNSTGQAARSRGWSGSGRRRHGAAEPATRRRYGGFGHLRAIVPQQDVTGGLTTVNGSPANMPELAYIDPGSGA